MPFVEVIQSFLIILFIIWIYGVTKSYAAYYLGDSSIKINGDLSLLPEKHLDLWGSILIPFILVATSGVFFGYGKSTKYNPYNLGKKEILFSISGFLVLIFIAIISIFFYAKLGIAPQIFQTVAFISLLFTFINLLPLPGFDGARLLALILPRCLSVKFESLTDSLQKTFGPFYIFFALFIIYIFIGSIFNIIVSILKFIESFFL